MALLSFDEDTQQKGLEELYEKLRVLEEGIKELFPSENHGHNDHLGMLDIMVGVPLGAYQLYEQVLGVKMLNPEKNPLIFSWVNHLNELPVMKQVADPPDKLFSHLQLHRKKHRNSEELK